MLRTIPSFESFTYLDSKGSEKTFYEEIYLFNPTLPNHGTPSAPPPLFPLNFYFLRERPGMYKSLEEDKGGVKEGKMEHAADFVLGGPERDRRRGREGGTGRAKCAGVHDPGPSGPRLLPHSESWDSSEREEGQPAAGLSPANLEGLQADSTLLVESWVRVPAR